MSTDLRAFYAQQYFGDLSVEAIQEMARQGGHQAFAAKFCHLRSANDRLIAENERLHNSLARLNEKAQRVLERLPS